MKRKRLQGGGKRQMNQSRQKILTDFLDEFSGAGEGRAIMKRLLDGTEAPNAIAEEVARSPNFERLYKSAMRFDLEPRAAVQRNPDYVGLSNLDATLPFAQLLEKEFLPRLGKRAAGFAVIFAELMAQKAKLFIVETGTLRIPGNWDGDGQSTFMFDIFVQQRGGIFYSIDVSSRSIDTARRACSANTNLINNDSVAALNVLSEVFRHSQADLLYLDSFDVDTNDVMPSAIHHAMELTAARPLVGPGTLICVDDYDVGKEPGGKALIVEKYLNAIGAVELYSGYQKVWRVR